jgi:protein-S-isoprenylcysteine O-methyltransferase Ste14
MSEPGMVYVKTLLFTLVAPCSVVAWIPAWLFRGSSLAPAGGWLGAAGAVLIVAGGAAYLWCAVEFAARGGGTPAPIDPPKGLVTTGLYRFVRNPMYQGVLAILAGETALFRAIEFAVYGVLVWFCFHLFVVLYEEPAQSRRFGAAYEAYRRTVPRWGCRIR